MPANEGAEEAENSMHACMKLQLWRLAEVEVEVEVDAYMMHAGYSSSVAD